MGLSIMKREASRRDRIKQQQDTTSAYTKRYDVGKHEEIGLSKQEQEEKKRYHSQELVQTPRDTTPASKKR